MNRSLLAVMALLTSGLMLACTSTSDHVLQTSLDALATPTATSTSAAAPAPSPPPCDAQASLRPQGPLPAPGQMPAGTFMRTIQDRGRLIVGVDQTTLLFGYRDPVTGTIQGFDVDMLREVARAIFGNPDAIEFKAATSAQRIPLVKSGAVDILASLVTMTCDRWQDVDFSSVYYLAHQKVLVRSGAGIAGVADLDGKRVCATFGSTSIVNIQKIAPRVILYGVSTRADCLVALQEGKVDAISTDDTILEGLHAQDPTTQVLTQPLTDEPYGMAIGKGHPEFIQFVNAVLDQIRRNGTWAEIDRRWLGALGATQPPPQARYRD